VEETESAHSLAVDSAQALAQGQPETPDAGTPKDAANTPAQDEPETPQANSTAVIFAPAANFDSSSQADPDDPTQPPVPRASESPNRKQETPNPGPPANIPEHARWLWHLARPIEKAG